MATTSNATTGMGVRVGSVAHATVTEVAVLRSRVDDLEKEVHEARHAIEELKEQNEQLRRQIAALRDGAWLRGS